MAAAAALNVVKQIQALAEGPQTPEMRACLGQVVSSLLFFLDHPDSRVRLSSSRTLLKLSEGYPEDMASLDMSRARAALKRTRASISAGTADGDAEELESILVEWLEGSGASGTGAATSSTAASTPLTEEARAVGPPLPEGEPAASSSASAPEQASVGEVVLQVTQEKCKAAILDSVVTISGVVSVTFEGDYVIVRTRSAAVASDAGFLADLLAAVKAQGVSGVSLVSHGGAAADGGAGSPSGGRDPSASAAAPLLPEDSTAAPAGGDEADEDADDDEGEPAYLDDDEDEVVISGSAGGPAPFGAPGMAGGPMGEGPKWSFFSQSNWMTGRKVQEFDDDPTIAARLAKAKKREEAKKEESRSRIGLLSSWFGGSQ